jgi:hypothetical protein
MDKEADNLRRRAEIVLGWEEGTSNQFSLITLRDLVRTKAPKLYYLMTKCIQSGWYIREDPGA